MSERKATARPEIGVEQLQAELKRVKYRKRFTQTILSTVLVFALISALALAASNLWVTAMRVHGDSMESTLISGDVVLAIEGMGIEAGDLVAFEQDGKLLVKRVIARAGDEVFIDADGVVSVNGEALSESYVEEPALGICDVEMPCTVPEGSLFLLGDHRSVSVDSRSAAIGFVKEERIVGKVVLRVWPLNRLYWLD